MPNNKLEMQVEVDSSGAIRGLQIVQQSIRAVAGEARKVGAETQFDKFADSVKSFVENPLKSAGEHAKALLATLGPVGTGITGVAVVATAAGIQLFELAAAAGKAAEQQVNFSDRLGISIGTGQRFSAMAKVAGVDVGVLEGATRILTGALEDSTGAGAKASRALQELGVATRLSNGEQRELGQVMIDTLKRLGDVEDTTKRTALANAILGRSAKEIQPLLKGYADLDATVRQLGIGLNESGTKQLAAMDDEIDKLELSFGRMRKSFAEKIAPIIIPIVQDITTLVNGVPQADLGPQDPFGSQFPRGHSPAEIERAITSGNQFKPGEQRTPIGIPKSFSDAIFGATAGLPQTDLLITPTSSGALTATANQAKLLRTDLDYITRRIEELRRGEGKEGLGAKSIGELQQTTIDPAVSKISQDAALRELQTREAEVKILERRKKLLEESRGVDDEIQKLRERNVLRADYNKLLETGDRSVGDTTLSALLKTQDVVPALGRFFDLAGRPSVNRSQRGQIFQALTPDIDRELGAEEKKVHDQFEKIALDLRKLSDAATDSDIETGLKRQTEQAQAIVGIVRQQRDVAFNLNRDAISSTATVQTRVIAAVAQPGQERAVIEADTSVRLSAANAIYDLTVKRIDEELRYVPVELQQLTRTLEMTKARGDLQKEIDDAAAERGLRLLELQQQRLGIIRNDVETLTHTLLTRPSDFARQAATTIRDAALKPVERGIANAAATRLEPIIFGSDGEGGINKFLSGLFGSKPTDPLKIATDANTRATEVNTQALLAFARSAVTTQAGAASSQGLASPAALNRVLNLLSPGGAASSTGTPFSSRSTPPIETPVITTAIKFDTEGLGFQSSQAPLPSVDIEANTAATIDNTAALRAFGLKPVTSQPKAIQQVLAVPSEVTRLLGLLGSAHSPVVSLPTGTPAVSSAIQFDTEGSGFGPSTAPLPFADTLASSIASAVPKFLQAPSSTPVPVSIVTSGASGTLGLTDHLGLPVPSDPLAFLPFVNSTPRGFNAFTRGLTSLAGGGNVFKAITGDDFSIQGPGGVTTTASAQGLTSTAGRLGTIVGAAGAVLGGVEGVLAGIKTGGARGAFGAIGSAAGAAAILDPEPISKAILAGVAVASELATQLFGDPKKKRQEAIDNELRGAYAPAPVSQAYTLSTQGEEIDYSYTGTARPVVNHYYNIQAIDAPSLREHVKNNGSIFADAVADQLGTHGPLAQGIRATANPN